MNRWSDIAGPDAGTAYAARMARHQAAGGAVHGEADLCAELLELRGGHRVLDAGCGTGRVAVRLAELGYTVVGVDADPSMLHQARRLKPALDWRLADLASFELEPREPPYDVVICAGNVIPLLAPGTLPTVLTRLAAALSPHAELVCGFGLDADHLPPGCPVTPLAEVDEAADRAGLTLMTRYATWERGLLTPDAAYAVSVYRRT